MIYQDPHQITTLANKAIGTGSAVTVMGWVTSSNLGLWVGIGIGIAGLLVNFYFRQKSDRRAAEAHRLYVEHLEENRKHHEVSDFDAMDDNQ